MTVKLMEVELSPLNRILQKFISKVDYACGGFKKQYTTFIDSYLK